MSALRHSVQGPVDKITRNFVIPVQVSSCLKASTILSLLRHTNTKRCTAPVLFIDSDRGILMSGIFSIDGKIALVTGGTSGIGYMIAQGLVKHGVKVYVASRKADACEKT